MPGTRAGTGQPLVFRCAKCRIGRDWRRQDSSGSNWVPTGDFRGDLRKPVFGRVSRTIKARYRCADCGHEGWTGHYHVIQRLRAMSEGIETQ